MAWRPQHPQRAAVTSDSLPIHTGGVLHFPGDGNGSLTPAQLLDELVSIRTKVEKNDISNERLESALNGVQRSFETLLASDALLPEETAAFIHVVSTIGIVVSNPSTRTTPFSHTSKRVLDILEWLSRRVYGHLPSRGLDDAVTFSLRMCAMPTVLVATNDNALTLSTVELANALAFRILGRLLYVDADRATRWHVDILNACVVILQEYKSRSVSVDSELVHAALVCIGNLLTKTGHSCRSQHATVLDPLISLLSAVGNLPAITNSDVSSANNSTGATGMQTGGSSCPPEVLDRVGRTLSSALRVLHVLLQSDDMTLKEAFGKNADALVRALQFSMRFAAALHSTPSGGKNVNAMNTSTVETTPNTPLTSNSTTTNNGGITAHPPNSVANGVLKGSPARGTNDSNALKQSSTVNGHLSPISPHRNSSGIGSGGGGWYSDSGSELSDMDDEDMDGFGEKYDVARKSRPNRGDKNSFALNTNVTSSNRASPGRRGRPSSGESGTSLLTHPRRIPLRVRVTALRCIVALSKSAPRIVQSRWSAFVPEVQGTHPAPFRASLLTVLLYDPSSRARDAAAAAIAAVIADVPLEKWLPALPTQTSQQQSHSQLAKPRAFSSLADKTAAMVRELHAGLERALTKRLHTAEAHRRSSLHASVLRAAAALAAATPYDRLSQQLPIGICTAIAQTMESDTKSLSLSIPKRQGMHTIGVESTGEGGTGTGSLPTAAVASHPQVMSAAIQFCSVALPRLMALPPVSKATNSSTRLHSNASTVTAKGTNADTMKNADLSVSGDENDAWKQLDDYLQLHHHPAFSCLVIALMRLAASLADILSTEKAPVISNLNLSLPELLVVLAKLAHGAHPILAITWPLAFSPLLNACLTICSADTSANTFATLHVASLRLFDATLRGRASAINSGVQSIPLLAHTSQRATTGSEDDTTSNIINNDGSVAVDENGKSPSGKTTMPISPTAVNTLDNDKHTATNYHAADTPSNKRIGVLGEEGDDDEDEDDEFDRDPLEVTKPRRITETNSVGNATTTSASESTLALEKSLSALGVWRIMTAAERLPTNNTVDHTPIRSQTTGVITPSPSVYELVRKFILPSFDNELSAVRAAACVCVSYLMPIDWQLLIETRENSDDNDEVLHHPTASIGDVFVCRALAAVTHCAVDASSSVRAASCRVWGAYAAFAAWRSARFLRIATEVLLAALRPDESLAVRAKASWALSNVICGGDADDRNEDDGALSIDALSAMLHRDANKTSAGIVHGNMTTTYMLLPDSLLDASDNSTDTIFSTLPLRPSVIEQLTSQRHVVQQLQVSRLQMEYQRRTIPPNAGTIASPLELYLPQQSQSKLVNALSLPLLRQVCHAALVLAESGSERVAGTAIRTLGHCARAIALHWLPVPMELRAVLDPVVVPNPTGDGILHSSSISEFPVQAEVEGVEKQTGIPGTTASTMAQSRITTGRRMILTAHCPDDAMLKTTMLLLADFVAAKDDVTHAEDTVSSALPSQSQPATTSTHAQATGSPIVKGVVKPAVLPAAGPRARGPAVFSRPTKPVASPAQPSTIRQVRPSDTVSTPPSSTSSVASTTATNPTSTSSHRAEPANSASDMPSRIPPPLVSAKIRWNACRAVGLVLPLMHRLASTHGDNWTASHRIDKPSTNQMLPSIATSLPSTVSNSRSSTTSGAAGELLSGTTNSRMGNRYAEDSSAPLVVDVDTSWCTPGAAVENALSALSVSNAAATMTTTANLNSPPRPRVRRNSQSGSITQWAGVDHISTAKSPFVVRPLPAPASPITGTSGHNAATNVQSESNESSNAFTKSTAMKVPTSSQGASTNTPHPSSVLLDSATKVPSSALRYEDVCVTDATLPTVTIDCTWGPSMLNSLQIALLRCSNYKVRIAAAQSLALIPSRFSYRVPGGSPQQPTDLLPSSLVPPVTLTGGNLDTGHQTGSASGAALIGWSASHLSPALQLPGTDAYPPTLMCLVTALEGRVSKPWADATELKYGPFLLAAVRCAVLHMLCVMERLDYGRMKPFLDGKAAFLLEWLSREQALVLPRTDDEKTSENGGQPVENHASNDNKLSVHTVTDTTESMTTDTPATDASEAPGTTTWPGMLSLTRETAISRTLVQNALDSITAAFASRVKSIPPSLLLRYKEATGQFATPVK